MQKQAGWDVSWAWRKKSPGSLVINSWEAKPGFDFFTVNES